MVGLVDGAVTTLISVPAFVTTLGTMFLINGLTLTISGGFPVRPAAPAFTAVFGGGLWAGSPGRWRSRSSCSSS